MMATAETGRLPIFEARDEKRLLRLQAQLAKVSLLIVDELGYVPLSQTGSELLFDVFKVLPTPDGPNRITFSRRSM